MDLTRRQEEFLRILLDLYHEQQEPLHYSVLAERLGVSRFTAYDMLRLLEEKGFAKSAYQLAEDKSGPGRSEVVYQPTQRAHRLMARLTEEVGGEDWESVKEHIMARVRSASTQPMVESGVAEEMLARVPPDVPESVRYCVEVMTVIALRLRRRASRQLLLDYLGELLPAAEETCRANLTLLGGFALGILADEVQSDEKWAQELLTHVRHYQQLLLEMKPEVCRRLARQLEETFELLREG
ncbi:MAG: hypothetical protein R3248_00850 [Candidatus Promineifilaceae bacterium]|nr:hypothetical protein [Candidatus Promineifilaceae bacterium]